MKRLKESGELLLSLAGAIALVVLTGCYEARPYPPPRPVYVDGYDYYYYPDQEVYYYPDTHVYFWFGDGEWRRGSRLPRTVVVHDETRVAVRINSRVPYEHHTEIRAKYPAHAPVSRHEEKHEEPMGHDGRWTLAYCHQNHEAPRSPRSASSHFLIVLGVPPADPVILYLPYRSLSSAARR
jgi:hypothetical protein